MFIFAVRVHCFLQARYRAVSFQNPFLMNHLDGYAYSSHIVLQIFSGSIFGVEVDYKAALGKLFLAFVWFGFWSVQNVKIKVINIQLGS